MLGGLGRGGGSRGDLLHLERLEAGGADPLPPGRGAFLDADLLQVGVAAAARRPQGVAARVAEVGPLAARITDLRHYTSPVLGYRSDLGTPEDATRAVSWRRAVIVPDR